MDPRFDSLDPSRESRSFIFREKRDEIVARTRDEVIGALDAVERAVRSGSHAAGFVAYEAAPAFDRALAAREPIPELPLLHFGIYAAREETAPLAGLGATGSYLLGPLVPSVSRDRYGTTVGRILDLIGAGDTYQVNYTFRLRGEFHGDPLAFYADLCQAQRSAYTACLDVGRHRLISASPELFFRLRGREIETRPMKGTRPRGRWVEEDDALAAELLESAKDRAENLMIVDLLRNDLGRVAEFGTVRVPRLFEIERYPTVHQLTSTVTGTLRAGIGLVDLFRALFPSGSVTGAPKIHTSEIIRDLEDSPRGAYTGAIGFVSPDEAIFSVAIRTVMLDSLSGAVELGVGSGITADSNVEAEYRECLEKGAFLRRSHREFELLESLRLELPGGYPFLEDHLGRLASSARYFGFPLREWRVRRALAAAAAKAAPGVHKVRLRLDRSGAVSVDSEPIPDRLSPARVGRSSLSVDPTDIFLFHKTTNRVVQERALADAPELDDLILTNSRGELTETTRANLVLEIDGELVTPHRASGLLAGVMRGRLLREGKLAERILRAEDLDRATRIYLINAVRGWREAILQPPATATPDSSRGSPAGTEPV